VPRALHRAGNLVKLITDLWISPARPGGRLYPRKLQERFHPELGDEVVKAFNFSSVVFEARHSVTGLTGWELILLRNNWFQERSLRELVMLADQHPGRRCCLFSFSYTARRLFEFAKSKGWDTVLGQIDPGPPDERIVARLHRQHFKLGGLPQPAPPTYWASWREECRLADHVIVNSSWSRQALLEEGVADEKIKTVPLAYEAQVPVATSSRRYPEAFTSDRPLRVLFLGQLSLRKGMAAILEAMVLLQNEPVEFWFVGPRQVELSTEWLSNRRARWLGRVSRSEAARYYQEADVFLFPTHSDGFGLTQLEAQAWKLPIVASRFCGNVVRDGTNGVLLREVSGAAVAEVIRSLVADPLRLSVMSCNSVISAEFSIDQLGSQLLRAVA